MNVRAIKTAEAKAAVNRIKNAGSRQFNLGVSLEVPKVFIEKRNYMQSDEFLKDAHNEKMFKLADALMTYRDEIADVVQAFNLHFPEKYVQAINGFIRKKSEIDKDFLLNFKDEPVLLDISEEEYRKVRNIQFHLESEKARA